MIEIILEDIPPSLNKFAGRKNVYEYRELKRLWKDWVYLKSQSVRPSVPLEDVIVHLHYIFPTKLRRDADNYNGKLILDGLVAAGIIKDDCFGTIDLKLSASHKKNVKKTIIHISYR